MKKRLIAQFVLDEYKISLFVSCLDVEQSLLFSEQVDIDGLYKMTNINKYADILNDLLTRANRELSTMIREVAVVYPDKELKIMHDKVTLVPGEIISNDLTLSSKNKLNEIREEVDYKLVKFEKHSFSLSDDGKYTVLGNSYYDNIKRIELVEEIFEIAKIRIILLIPKSLLLSYSIDASNFVNIDISVDYVRINVFRNNMLWEQFLMPSSIEKYLWELSKTYKLSKNEVMSKILQYVDMSDLVNDRKLFVDKYNEIGALVSPELLTSSVRLAIDNFINEMLNNVLTLLIENNMNQLKVVFTGQAFHIKGMKQSVISKYPSNNIKVIDIYHERLDRLYFQNIGEKYIKNNNSLSSGDTNLISSIKEKALSITSNHSKLLQFKFIINMINKNSEWSKKNRR